MAEEEARSGGFNLIEPRFVTLKDVASYLSVSEVQVYALVRSGALPAIKIGARGIWRVDRHRLERFLDQLHEETAAWVRTHPLIEEARPRPAPRGPQPLPEDAAVMSIQQAAKVIGVSRQNVNHLVRMGRLPAMKTGHKWLVSAEDVRSYQALGSRQAEGDTSHRRSFGNG